MKKQSLWLLPPLLWLLQLAGVYYWSQAEHTIYYWDHAMYNNMASLLWQNLQQNPHQAWDIFRQSLRLDYNMIFTLPSMLSFSWFGHERLTFILTNFVVYAGLQQAAFTLLLRRGLLLNWVSALSLSLLAFAAMPFAWIPLLQGYPDNSAAAALSFAAAVAVGQNRGWRKGWLLGLMTGLCVLLRRHYAYGALTLLFTSGCFDLFALVKTPKAERLQQLRQLIIYYALVGLMALGVMLAIAPDFVIRITTTNYNNLYNSYRRETLSFLAYALTSFGYGLSLAALAGLLLTMQRGLAIQKIIAAKILLWGLLWLTLWSLGPVQIGPHYILQMLPNMVGFGLVALVVYVWRMPNLLPLAKLSVCSGFAALLLANTFYALWFAPVSLPSVAGPASTQPRINSNSYPPVVRDDYAMLQLLADHLYNSTHNDDRIAVLGSSFNFNQDIIRALYTDVLKLPSVANRFLPLPEIDGVQDPPYYSFASANIYVVPEPMQYHLDKAGQKVVTAIANQFPPPAARADLFRQDLQSYALQDGVVVKIWRRVQRDWPPAKLHQALGEMAQVFAEPTQGSHAPDAQSRPRATASKSDGGMNEVNEPQSSRAPTWVPTKQGLRMQMGNISKDILVAQVALGLDQTKAELFYNQPLDVGAYRFGTELQMSPNCRSAKFKLSVVTGNGTELLGENFEPLQFTGSLYHPFVIHQTGENFVKIQIALPENQHNAAGCEFLLQNFRIEREKD